MGETDAQTAWPQPPWPAGAAWIDGGYRPVEDAKISVLDLGVTRSDGTYDVVHVWDGRFFRLDDHLDRFAASLARLRLEPGHDRAAIEAMLHGCVRHAGLRAAYVSMTCTRGRPAPGSRDLRTARNAFYCYAVPFVWISAPDRQAAGASLWISPITEGPGFNVFAHVDGRWLTPASGTLRGITRRSVIELTAEAGQPLEEGRLTAADLRRASEVLVSSTAGGVMPVTLIDGEPVGVGQPGPLTLELRERYWASHQDPRYSTAVRYDEPD